jgi:hypothetical protein
MSEELASRCGIEVGGVYALGLENGDCPVGVVTALDADGVALTLYSWYGRTFDVRDTWAAFRSIRQWVRAERLTEAGRDDGGFLWSEAAITEGVFAMDPLAAFQTRWKERHEPREPTA